MLSDFVFRFADPKKDACSIPFLIRECFHHWMDLDNWSYLSDLIRKGSDSQLNSLRACIFPYSVALNGMVCETANGRVIGYAAYFPACHEGIPGVLVANVCVDEAYRRQGIAGELLKRLLEERKRAGCKAAYLQVRDTKNGALPLYLGAGFLPMDERISWIAPKMNRETSHVPSYVEFKIPHRSEMSQVYELFEQYNPFSVSWNQPSPYGVMNSGRVEWLWNRLFKRGLFTRVEQAGSVLGWAVVSRTKTFCDRLWWLPLEPLDTEGCIASLNMLRAKLTPERPLLWDRNAFLSDLIPKSAGFLLNERIIWMRKTL